MNDEKLHNTVIHVINLLVQGEYGRLETLSKGKWVTAVEMRKAIDDYGRRLTMPPVTNLESINIIEIENSTPPQWYVGIDLWTLEEGRSDLTLELTLTDSSENFYIVEVDGLHIL